MGFPTVLMGFQRMRKTLTWTILAAGVATATALAAPIRGSVQMPSGSAAEPASEENTYYWKVWNGVVDPRTPRPDPSRELAVVLTGEGVEEPIGCTYAIRGGDLHPATLVVKAGAAMRIENRDGCSHELQSEGIPDFAPLATAPGNARAINVPAGGPYTITDRLYGHVSGTVHPITDLAACARVGADGAFVFEGIPNGEYTLKIFRGAEEVHAAPVVVQDAPITIEPAIGLGGS